ncbi:MAG: radical SAM protein [Prolixibacteraceae bacterium]|nr:radical SAM protein [Prolixibacteraceae bacterium]
MATFLFDKTVFGPVISRRLGISLGINLLPNTSKLCSFDCIYCECGWNPDPRKVKALLPTRREVSSALERKLSEIALEKQLPDVITFAGNGEPTMHPNFSEIIDDTIEIRNRLAPGARIAVLSNSMHLNKPKVFEALKKVDDNILKLDSAIAETIEIMDRPVGRFNLEKLVEQLCKFNGKLVIQTMFLKGSYQGREFDNTTQREIDAWIGLLKKIKPEKVMIYTIARDTPIDTLQKVSEEKLCSIAEIVNRRLNIKTEVSG